MTVCTEYIFGLPLAVSKAWVREKVVVTVPETVCILAQWNHSKPNAEIHVTRTRHLPGKQATELQA